MRSTWILWLALLSMLSGCERARPQSQTREGTPEQARLHLPIAAEFKDDVFLGDFPEPIFFVCRYDASYGELKTALHLEAPLPDYAPNFGTDMVLGAVDMADTQQRSFRIFRVYEHPDCIEAHVVSYRRKKTDQPTTPCSFVAVPRSDKPVRFLYNSEFAWSEELRPWAPGLHEETVVRRHIFHVYVPTSLRVPAPLVVLLHGSVTNGKAYIHRFTEAAEEFGFVLLAPTAMNGYYWQEEIDYAVILDEMAQLMRRLPIDPERVFLGGSSAGGHTAYPFALEHRERFAAFFSVVGRLNPSVEDAVVARAKDMPILLMPGVKDTMVPIESVLKGKERLEKAGAKVTLIRIEDGGHDFLKHQPERAREIFQWLDAVGKSGK